MRRFLPWVGGALVAMALGLTAQHYAHAMGANPSNAELAAPVNPAPLAPKHPVKCSLTGNASCCVVVGLGQRARAYCTVGCAWDVALTFADGGIGFPDGGLATINTDSNQLGAATPEWTALPPGLDSVCAFSTSAGTFYAAPSYP